MTPGENKIIWAEYICNKALFRTNAMVYFYQSQMTRLQWAEWITQMDEYNTNNLLQLLQLNNYKLLMQWHTVEATNWTPREIPVVLNLYWINWQPDYIDTFLLSSKYHNVITRGHLNVVMQTYSWSYCNQLKCHTIMSFGFSLIYILHQEQNINHINHAFHYHFLMGQSHHETWH